MKTSIDYNAIQEEIDNNFLDLKSGVKDCYEFIHEMTLKYIKPIKPECMECLDENPFADMLFAMLEINGIELY
ncbi:hypothetical protein [Polaribacter sp.]|uniref:hypothetical protein n=1 Tax=Polaribacter sp. TaxID=1920175 RepID=UPI003F6C4771